MTPGFLGFLLEESDTGNYESSNFRWGNFTLYEHGNQYDGREDSDFLGKTAGWKKGDWEGGGLR